MQEPTGRNGRKKNKERERVSGDSRRGRGSGRAGSASLKPMKVHPKRKDRARRRSIEPWSESAWTFDSSFAADYTKPRARLAERPRPGRPDSE